MAQTNFTPIQLYRTSTAAAVPTAGNLAAGELAINLTDERLYFKNAAGVVKLLASNAGALGTVTSVDGSGGTTGLTLTGGPITSSGTLTLGGTLGVANGGTGTGTAFTAGSVVFAGASGVYSQDNANLFWDNSNDRLGIGTASPLARLHVAGGTGILVSGNGASGFNYAQFSNDVSNGVAIGVGGSTASGWTQNLAAVFNASNNPLAFGTNNLERMRIASGGDVGIGTASPGARLNVVGGNIAVDADTRKIGYITDGTAANTGYMIPYDGSGFLSLHSNFATAGIKFHTGTGNDERMRITAAGDVGIGISAPGSRLDVVGGDVYRVFRAGTATGGVIEAGLLGQSIIGIQSLTNSGNFQSLVLNPNGGNVGIGTASPTDRLQVTGGALRVENTLGFGATMLNTSGMGMYMTLADQGSSSAIGTNNGSLIFYNNSNTTERMRINSAGNVGIGTTTPGAKLDVNGTSNFSDNMTLSRTNTAGSLTGITVTNAGTSSAYAGINIVSGPVTSQLFNDAAGNAVVAGTILRTTTAHPLVFGTNGSEHMRITSGGNVGIGTSSPGAKFTVAGASELVRLAEATPYLSFYNAAQSTRFGYIQHTGTALALVNEQAGQIEFYTNAAERMRITTAGDIAIGTPTARGNLSIGTLITTATTQTLHMGYTAGDFYGWRLAATNTPGSTAAGTFNIQRGNSAAWVNDVTIDNSGNVGIGTSSPTVYSGYTTLELDNASNGGILSIKKAGSVVGYINGASGMLMLAQSNDIKLTTTGSTTIQFSTNAIERARIDSSGNFLWNKTSLTNETTVDGVILYKNSSGGGSTLYTTNGGTGTALAVSVQADAQAVAFFRSGTLVGSISVTSTSTAYNTSSDYRLKDVDGPITNSGAYVDALKPVQGSWKSDGSRFIGLLAHEVQEVSETPIATGEKDGEKMQAMDYSAPELIANLIAEIQSLRARVAQLEERK